MKILFLDDEQARHDRIVQIYDGETGLSLNRVFTYNMFEMLLNAMSPLDIIYLDHDLGDTKTGEDAALLIAALPPEKRPKEVRVHSFNPVGARRIIQVLQDVGIEAYTTDLYASCWSSL